MSILPDLHHDGNLNSTPPAPCEPVPTEVSTSPATTDVTSADSSSALTAAQSDNVDHREALFNGGAIGPIEHIQVSAERIVSLCGVLFDLDPHLIRQGPLTPTVPHAPPEFYATLIRPMLERHPVLAKAEVRNSGRGLHAILRFTQPVEFNDSGDRDRWRGIVEVVQAALPIDPDQPGITATTRAIGSVNGKNGATVMLLAPGEPVTAEEVMGLFDELVAAPFRTVMRILTGSETIEPCPICEKADSKLSAQDRAGLCYGSCGKVKLADLYDLVLKLRNAGKEASHAQPES